MSQVNKLVQLALDEVSAVDQPANMLPGYMVMKARHAERHPATGRYTTPRDPGGGGAATASSLAEARAVDAATPLPGVPHNQHHHTRTVIS